MSNPSILIVEIGLDREHEERDAATIDALRSGGLKWFTHVALVVPAWQECPDAAGHNLIKHAYAIYKSKETVGVVWGRQLWNRWEGMGYAIAGDAPQDNATWYATALATLHAEARQLHADMTMLDITIDGFSHIGALKTAALTDEEQGRIYQATSAAMRYVPCVDIITPVTAWKPNNYAWLLSELGRWRYGNETMFAHAPDYTIRAVNPPPGYELKRHLWSVVLTKYSTGVALSPTDLLALDLTQIRTLNPDCMGFAVQPIKGESLRDILDALERAVNDASM